MDLPDAVVVGAGPNGLTAAVTLAREGLRVRVYEAQDAPGGAVRSALDTLPGVVHDRGASLFPLAVGSPVLARWPLGVHGLRWSHPPLPAAHPLPGGAVAVHRSLDRTASELGEDGAAWRGLVGPVAASWETLAPQVLAPMLRAPGAPGAWLRFGARALPPAAATRSLFRDGRARALWAGMAAHAPLPPTAPGTSAAPLVLAALAHARGWPFPVGGAGRLTEALVSYLTSLGGELRTGAPVRDLGELPPARVCLLDVTPEGLARLAEGRLPPRYARALRRYRRGPGVVKVDLAVEGGLPWADPACAAAGTVHLGGDADLLAAAQSALARGRPAERPFVLVAQPGRFDRSRTRGGVQPAWAYAHLPQRLAGDAGAVRDCVGRILDAVEQAAPGTRARTRAVRVWSPDALAAGNANLTGGDPSAGATDLWQMAMRPTPSWTPYVTPLAGVYLCSAATPPGPGVHGMAGFWAAHAALWREFGVRASLPPGPERGAARLGGA